MLLLLALLAQDRPGAPRPETPAEKPQEFSGPRAGEAMPKDWACRIVHGEPAEKDVRVAEAFHGSPALYVFIHEINRPVAALVRELGSWAQKQPRLKAAYILLTADKIATFNYVPTLLRAVNLPYLGVSLDGLEGPGCLGLNKEMTLTVLVADPEGKVTAGFAIRDASAAQDNPKIKAAVQEVVGTPTFSTLEEALREIQRLNALIEKLEAEIETLKQQGRKPAGRGDMAPEDPRLIELMRGLIQLKATAEEIQAVEKSIRDYVGDNADLKRQVHDIGGRIKKAGYGNSDGKAGLDRLLEWSKPPASR